MQFRETVRRLFALAVNEAGDPPDHADTMVCDEHEMHVSTARHEPEVCGWLTEDELAAEEAAEKGIADAREEQFTGASVIWSPDFDAYASGMIDAHQIRCVLCQHAPCDCPPFGSDEYFALLDRRHGRS